MEGLDELCEVKVGGGPLTGLGEATVQRALIESCVGEASLCLLGGLLYNLIICVHIPSWCSSNPSERTRTNTARLAYIDPACLCVCAICAATQTLPF